MTSTIGEHGPEPAESAALDAYSRVVTSVAAELTPSVAALYRSERTPNGQVATGTGSAVVFTDDGFLLTNAHVVGNSSSGNVSFADGSTSTYHVIGADPLSDLAVVRADGPTPQPARLG